jgi:hypothetical protein
MITADAGHDLAQRRMISGPSLTRQRRTVTRIRDSHGHELVTVRVVRVRVDCRS